MAEEQREAMEQQAAAPASSLLDELHEPLLREIAGLIHESRILCNHRGYHVSGGECKHLGLAH